MTGIPTDKVTNVTSTETGEDVVDVLVSVVPNLTSLTAAGNPFYQDVRMHFTASLSHKYTNEKCKLCRH